MASLTLKDIPKRLHQRLRERAQRNRRSLSQEALACLEQIVAADPIDPDALLAKARAMRSGVKPVSPREIEDWINRGRP